MFSSVSVVTTTETTLQLLGITARAADTDGNQSSRSLHALHASAWLLSKHLQLPPACTKTREEKLRRVSVSVDGCVAPAIN